MDYILILIGVIVGVIFRADIALIILLTIGIILMLFKDNYTITKKIIDNNITKNSIYVSKGGNNV